MPRAYSPTAGTAQSPRLSAAGRRVLDAGHDRGGLAPLRREGLGMEWPGGDRARADGHGRVPIRAAIADDTD